MKKSTCCLHCWNQMGAGGKNIFPGEGVGYGRLCYHGGCRIMGRIFRDTTSSQSTTVESSACLRVSLKRSLLMKNKKQEALQGC